MRILTVALHRHHLPHYVTLSVGCCRGHHKEEDGRYTYVHLARSNLQWRRRRRRRRKSVHLFSRYKKGHQALVFVCYFVNFREPENFSGTRTCCTLSYRNNTRQQIRTESTIFYFHTSGSCITNEGKRQQKLLYFSPTSHRND